MLPGPRYAVPAVDFVMEGVDGDELVKRPKQIVPLTNLNMIAQLCTLLDATLIDHPRMADPQLIEALFIFCTVWSIGSVLVQQADNKDR
jgi:dynein heavy chain